MLLVANWKMHGDVDKVRHDFADYIMHDYLNHPSFVVALPLHLLSFAHYLNYNNNTIDANTCGTHQNFTRKFKLACQNISIFDDVGPYTGEVSASMLAKACIEYAIIGHSERRTHFAENSDIIVAKINNALNNHITPIICIGEDIIARKKNFYKAYLLDQLSIIQHLNIWNIFANKDLYANIPKIRLIVAYEPLWAIGTGEIAKNHEIEEIIALIKQYFFDNCLPDLCACHNIDYDFLVHCITFDVLYGGSVNHVNISDVMSINGINGVLVGGASLILDNIKEIGQKLNLKLEGR